MLVVQHVRAVMYTLTLAEKSTPGNPLLLATDNHIYSISCCCQCLPSFLSGRQTPTDVDGLTGGRMLFCVVIDLCFKVVHSCDISKMDVES